MSGEIRNSSGNIFRRTGGEFLAQGTLAERCRAGGAGIPASHQDWRGHRVAEGKEVKI